MAWGDSTLGTLGSNWKWPKGLLSPFGFNRIGLGKALGPASAPFSAYSAGQDAEKRPGLMSINPLAAPGLLFKMGIDKTMGWNQGKMPTDYPKHASGALPTAEFNKGMEKSVAEASKSGDDDPFNFNQLFLASILQGLKQKPPASASGKVAGSYIPKPELPKMSDYDSNKTYWNIG